MRRQGEARPTALVQAQESRRLRKEAGFPQAGMGLRESCTRLFEAGVFWTRPSYAG